MIYFFFFFQAEDGIRDIGVTGVRRVLFRSPLTNPAGANRQLIGVSDARFLDTIAAALGGLGGRTALVVSSEDGLDEISVSAPTRAVELKDGGEGATRGTPRGWAAGRFSPAAVV